MCSVSMVMDYYQDKWRNPNWPNLISQVSLPYLSQTDQAVIEDLKQKIETSKKDIETLRKEVLEMKELIKRAKRYDEENDEKDCEVESKISFVRKIANLLNVDITDVLKKND